MPSDLKWNAGLLEQKIWELRLADMERDANRAVLNRLFNGEPPLCEEDAEEQQVQINYNDLEGVNLLAQARRQWNTAFLNPENYFSISLDSGPDHKRGEWARTITRHANRLLKQNRNQMEQARATGANVILHGMGACTWDTRRSVIPRPLAPGSVLIPSETDIDFENCNIVSFFREWTPEQFYAMTHGPRIDPGWNMKLVNSQLAYTEDQISKQSNSTAYLYMPTKVEELVKQDGHSCGIDAVPTIDVWDSYLRSDEDDGGWVRRITLDWGITPGSYGDRQAAPDHANRDADGTLIYTSGKRKFANSISEILHCNFGDCSAVAPFKVHSVRSLGWMLWSVCHLQNLLHCRFFESVFKDLLVWFRVANNQDLQRLKMAVFSNMAVIPAGITEILSKDRHSPSTPLVNMAFQRNESLMNKSAASFSADFDKGPDAKEMTATETMARVNQVNALVSGMLTLAYTYEDYKYHEQCRRLCIKIKPDPIAAKFRLGCLKDGVPEEMLDVERWRVQSDRVLGAGNKTLAMAQVTFLQSIRKNLNPDAQRIVDHESIEVYTDSPEKAEQLAPIKGQKQISNSMHDAQLSTERLMRGLPLVPRPDNIPEDFVKVWIADLEMMVQRTEKSGGMAKPEDLVGYQNMAQQIGNFLNQMGQNEEEKPKVKEYGDRLAKAMNLVKAFAQRLQQQAKAAGNGAPAPDPKQVVAAQLDMQKGKQKLAQGAQSHATKTAQRQVSFDMKEQQDDRRVNAEIRRENAKAFHETLRGNMKSLNSTGDDDA